LGHWSATYVTPDGDRVDHLLATPNSVAEP
jgi:hypothetical protein